MTTQISGDTGVSQIQDGVVSSSAKIAAGAVSSSDLSGQQGGSAPIFGARAWCLFNGALTGTNTPISGGNISSVTRESAGVYTLNFTTALPDADYAVTFGNVSSSPATLYQQGLAIHTTTGTTPTLKTTTQLRIVCYAGNSNADQLVDSSQISVSIIR